MSVHVLTYDEVYGDLQGPTLVKKYAKYANFEYKYCAERSSMTIYSHV